MISLLLFLALSASAAAPEPCVEVASVGCVYVPHGAGAHPPLLIYMRGFWGDYKNAVPRKLALKSSRQAFSAYELEKLADASRSAVLVTYKSALTVDEATIGKLREQTGLDFSRRIVAAHSGAYEGLNASLDAGLQLDRLIMLDDFYSGSALAKKIQFRFPAKGSCVGYYTPHTFERKDGSTYDNRAHFQATFRPFAPSCAIEELPEGSHDDAVTKCLLAYMTRETCR